jgi:hypothetical protein
LRRFTHSFSNHILALPPMFKDCGPTAVATHYSKPTSLRRKGAFELPSNTMAADPHALPILGQAGYWAQADEAENSIAGLIRGDTAGPAGLLWVRQRITGIESEPAPMKMVKADPTDLARIRTGRG